MNMFIRIFYGGYCKDISLQNSNDFYIGSRTDKGFEIPNSDMLPEHIRLHCENGNWTASRIGEIYLDGKPIETSALRAMQFYTLSIKNRISMLVINEYQEKIANVSLGKINELTIGRNEDNDIVLHSGIVSGNHAKISKTSNGYRIDNLSNSNGTFIDGKKIDSHILKDNDEVVICGYKLVYNNDTIDVYGEKGSVAVNVEKVQANNNNETEKRDSKIIFKRSPRMQLDIPTGDIEIQSPPNIGSKPEKDWLTMLQPLMVSLPMAVIMGFFGAATRGIMYLFSVGTAVVGVAMSVRNNKKQTKKFEEKEGLRLEKYTQHLESATEEIEEKRAEQLSALNLADPDINECFSIAVKRARRMWERRPSDKDFMNIRIGNGEIDFSMKISIPKSSLSLEEDDLKNRPQEIYDKYCKVQNAPITFSMQEYPICGVVGNYNDTNKLICNMVAQVATHHCYTDVKIVFVNDKTKAQDLEWVKYLPHSYSDDRTQPLIAETKAEAEVYFKNFDDLFKRRKMSNSEDNSYGKKAMQLPYYLFVITAPEFLSKKNPMNDYLFRSKNLGLGIGVILAVEDKVQLPPECERIIEINGKKGTAYNTNTASQKQEFVLDASTSAGFVKFGKALMPVFCEDTNTKNAIPKKYSFYEMLGIKNAEELNIGANWAKSDIENTVSAPLGIYGRNELLYLDLHEEAHGSHGLVAGKTGSGKSEVLLSYLVAMATRYSPYEVNFLIVDFKGGGMSDRLAKLPHLNASITNMDGEAEGEIDSRIINRSLTAIRAESLRRQDILRKAKAKDIGDYIEKYKNHKVDMPLPHLIIVVDEFAELKQQFPEFMKELVSASRIGRSLGIHLILATQSPAGVVDDQIWNNSNFKLSLAVLDESSSNAVLKSPEAAHINTPGRGYLKVGNGTLFEMFQSGYSGLKVKDKSGKEITQLDAVIGVIGEFCKENNIEKLPSICLPPLPKKLGFAGEKSKDGTGVTVGVYDAPENCYQGNYELSIFSGNTMIIGSSQTDRTNLIQGMIRTIASNYAPDEVSMYIIDFSSMFLKNFETLNHVGGVVTNSEDEKLKNLFKLLYTELANRKEKQLSVGVSSFSAYKEAGYTDLAQIVVFIDNLTALKEQYFQDDDMLLNLCAESNAYGITFVIANSQTSGIGYKYLTHFSNRVALYCNDSTEYMSLFEGCREKLDDIPNRALCEINKHFYECQIYTAFEGEKEIDKTNEIKQFIEKTNKKCGNIKAAIIPVVPELIKAEDTIQMQIKHKNDRYQIMFGLDYDSVEPLFVELASVDILGISGREASGKHNFIRYTVDMLDKLYSGKSEVYIFDAINRKLSDISTKDNVKAYEILAENAKLHLVEIDKELEKRYKLLAEGNNDVLSNSNMILLIINSIDMLDELCKGTEAANAMRNIIGKYKNMNVCMFVGNYENKNIPYGANEFVKKIKEDRHILFFDDLSNLKIFDAPLAVLRRFKKPIKNGDGHYIKDNEYKRIKTILDL